jgi:2'-deoxynucleoside 5'-phosphate N-hydrolase
MKIYFACSITGGREFEGVYQELVAALGQAGHQVLTAHLAESGAGAWEAEQGPQAVYARDTDWIRECDVLIAEVSVPSHGVGYEIAFALGLGKPVLALHQTDRRVSKMITGNPDPLLQVRSFEDTTVAIGVLREYLTGI